MNLNWIVRQKIKVDRGVGLVSWAKTIVLGGVAIKVFFPDVTRLGLVLSGICMAILLWCIGSLDFKIGFFQKENEMLCTEFNPQLNKIK